MIKNELWVEKYRPTSLEQLALSEPNRNMLENCLKDGEIPNLLLAGPPGIGKTTLAQILVSNLDCRHIVLNASKERGIDTIREKVGTFARSSMGVRWNIIVMDEADALTRDAQTAMRNLMETFSNQTRFILTANYIQKILVPIRSRCMEVHLSDLSPRERAIVLVRILKAENIPVEKQVVVSYAKTYTDLRRMISAAHKSYLSNGTLLPARSSTVDAQELWGLVVQKKWKELVKLSQDENTDHQQMLIDLFWAVPDDGPVAATYRSIIEEKISTSSFTPDAVVHFLGTCATLMTEM